MVHGHVRDILKTDSRLLAISLVLAAVIFALDLFIPLGVAGGVPYVALVASSAVVAVCWPEGLLMVSHSYSITPASGRAGPLRMPMAATVGTRRTPTYA